MGLDICPELLKSNIFTVLSRHNDGIYSGDLSVIIFYGHLSLAIRSEVRQRAVLSDLRQSKRKHVRKLYGKRHQLSSLGIGIAEHHALIAGSYIRELIALNAFFRLERLVDAHGYVRRLFFHMHDYSAGVAVETRFFVIIAYIAYHLSCDRLIVYIEIARCFAEYHEKARLRCAFARNVSIRILRQDRVEHGI